jgi:hypothetical protein
MFYITPTSRDESTGLLRAIFVPESNDISGTCGIIRH